MTNQLTTLPFHGASLIVQKGDTPETTMVAMKPIVEGMGLDWSGQHKKLASHPVLSQGISIMEIPSAGGVQGMTALPLHRLPFWLATLHPNKIKEVAVREKVVTYQSEAADALFHHFFGRPNLGTVKEIDESTRRVLGGMIKSNAGVVFREQLAPVNAAIEGLQRGLLAIAAIVQPAHPGVYVEGRSSGEIWRDAGLPPKIKNGARWLGNRLAEMGCQLDGCRTARVGLRSARVFDPDKAAACMKNGLHQKALSYVAERRGQKVLRLVPAVEARNEAR